MNTLRPLIVTLAAAAGCAGAVWMFTQHSSESKLAAGVSTDRSPALEESAPARPAPPSPEQTVSPPIPEPQPVVEAAPPASQPQPSELPKKTAEVKPPRQNAPAAPPPRPKKERLDPVARVALSWVGADPEAEEYWVEAINDPRLSGHERSDLIEDLNEEGFPDPKNPTFDDLPLIVNRLRLIEELAPDAMDAVNWDAFAEAKKDLVNMAFRALQ